MNVLGRTTLGLALTTLLAACGGGSQSAQPSPAVASAPSAGPTVGAVEPTDGASATAEPATVTPTPPHGARDTARDTAVPTPAATGPATGSAKDMIRLTLREAGATVTVAPGTVIVVELAGGPGSWRTPTTESSRVLRADSTRGGYPAQGPAVATFTAIGAASARVVSTTDAACFHSRPACLLPVQQFTVTIRVR